MRFAVLSISRAGLPIAATHLVVGTDARPVCNTLTANLWTSLRKSSRDTSGKATGSIPAVVGSWT